MKLPHFKWQCYAFLFSLFVIQVSAQKNDSLSINYNEPQDFEIGGIEILGAKQADEKAILAVSGLKIGSKIKIPSGKMQRAMKALLKLKLFSNIEINIQKTIGAVVFLEILVEEKPRMSNFKIKGVRKNQRQKLKEILEKQLLLGAMISENDLQNAKEALAGFYLEKGFSDVAIKIDKMAKGANSLELIFEIDKGKKIRVDAIHFLGNNYIPDSKLYKLLGISDGKGLLDNSKLLETDLEIGKKAIIQHYRKKGYRDAFLAAEKIKRNKAGNWVLYFQIAEGTPYYFGDIVWEGNSIFSDAQLSKVLGIKNGEIFNEEKLETRLNFSPDASDITSIYMDNGFLFFRMEALEKQLRGDTIDLEIRISEGRQATIDKVVIKGNDRTNEGVIRREIYTEPGKKFSRSDVIRSQRAIINLGYFNPEKLDLQTSVNPERGTVDLIYDVTEMSTDRFEMAAGWSGEVGLTGTLGVNFNNFSIKNLFKKRWGQFAKGEGQQLSMRIQSNGPNYQSYNFSFTEPWLGGKKSNALTFSGFYNQYAGTEDSETGEKPKFKVLGFSTSLGSRLRIFDGNFVSRTSLNFQKYSLNNWSNGLFTTDEGHTVSDGNFYNIYINQTFARSTLNHPIFPSSGSRVSLSMKFTPPYSLFNKDKENETDPAQRFQFLEYHKWRIDAEFYKTLVGKLVLKSYAKFGYLGSYNSNLGTSPFERFRLGGHGIDVAQQGFTGTDPISLRGYERTDLENNFVNGEEVATSVFNKFGLELRYPISTNPSSTIYALTFAEFGNAWQSFKDYQPFDLKRSVGVGFRAHLPIFGTIGVDYSLGLDKEGNWKNNFQIGVILGFEPD